VQDVKDLMQHLIDAWLEWKRALFKMSLTIGARISPHLHLVTEGYYEYSL